MLRRLLFRLRVEETIALAFLVPTTWLTVAAYVARVVLAALLSDAYFAEPPPKSLDRNHFPARHLAGLSTEDGAATLVAFTWPTGI